MHRLSAILLSLVLLLGATASGALAQNIEYRPVEDELFGVSSVVPADWQDQGFGSYSRGTPPADLALIAIQSTPGAIDEVWPALLPQFGLDAVPEVSDERSLENGDWQFYRFDLAPGGVDVAVEVVMSERDGTTYLLLMQSAPDEFATLREQVLVPAVEAFTPYAPEPDIDPDGAGYRSEEVAFPGGAEGVELAGTLTLPDTSGPHPVVVTMSGSGPSDRDESLAPISTFKPFADLADALTGAGVGVLRYDDRGVGESTGEHGTATIQDFTADAAAALDYLTTRDDVDAERIGLFGHSEGGLYAAMLGASDPRVAYIGMMGPGVVDGISLIVEQNVLTSRAAGASDELAEAAGELAAEIMPLVVAGEFAEVRRIGREFFGQLWDGLTPEEQSAVGDRDAYIESGFDAQMPIYESDWYRSFLAYDSVPDWEQVTVPVLGIFGGKDTQVAAEPNEAALREALEVAGNEDVTTVVIPDANHLFQEAETGAFSEYGELEPEFIDGFLDTVVDWMVVRADVGK